MTHDEVALMTRHIPPAARFRVLRAMTDAMRQWEHGRLDDGQTRLTARHKGAAIFAAQEVALIAEGALTVIRQDLQQ